MRLSELLDYMDNEFEKEAAAEEAETLDSLEKRNEAILLGRALAEQDLGL